MMNILLTQLIFIAALGLGLPQIGAAETEQELHKIKVLFNQRVPMRDGVELSADVFKPRQAGRYPTLLMRTPYNKGARRGDLPWEFTTYFAQRGYVLSSRTSGDAGTPTANSGICSPISRMVTTPWNGLRASRGRTARSVCGGVSYHGAVQWQAAKTRPPSLVCLVSTAAAGDYMDEVGYGAGGIPTLRGDLFWLHNVSGRVWREVLLFDLMAKGHFNPEEEFWHRPLMTLDEAAFGTKLKIWRDYLSHPTMDDYWKEIKLQPEDFRNIELPVLHITGWFDGDQPGAMHYWRGMQKHSKARDQQFLVIGPWLHVQTFFGGAESVGELQFGPESVIDPWALRLEFLDHYLKGTTNSYDHPKARLYITGANEWREYDEYPPRQANSLRFYLHSGGNANTLSGDGRLRLDKPGTQPTDGYTFDPKNPVPSSADGKMGLFGVDHRPVEAREDVLVYTSEVLDKPIDVVGNVLLELYAASDARDTDFFTKLLDVYPDGRALRLGAPGGALRARYRNGFDKERLLTPGKVEKFTIDLEELGHRFLPGHRIRIEVTSSSFPYYAPNQNTGNPVATDIHWNTAHQTIYHNMEYPSALVLSVVEK